MCDLLLKNGYPVDYIVFNDTLDEFEEMYDYLDKLESYFKRKYNKKIIRTKPNWTYDRYIFGERTRGKREGTIRGLPKASDSFCTWRKEAKMNPFDKWVNNNIDGDYRVYIGITTDEKNRANREDKNKLYPLIDIFQMSELDCKRYLENEDMENPLYKHFTRTGCKKCQYQSERDFFKIWKHFPDVWEEMKIYEKKVKDCKDATKENSYWFVNYQSCSDLERKFELADKQGSLFDFSDEPLKDCFCKI